MIVLLRKWILSAVFTLFRPLPLRNRVVFASSHAVRLGGNLKALHDEMERRSVDAGIVVLLRSSTAARSGKLDTLRFAIIAEYYLATSRVFIVDDYFFPIYVIQPKPHTTIIQTWHASGAFKKVGYSVLDKTFGATDSLVRRVRIHSNYTYCLVGSKNAIPFYSEAFGQPPERFVSLGIPRDDLFSDVTFSQRAADNIRTRYRLPANKKTILYAPTFRGTSKHAAAYYGGLDLHALRDVCGGEYVLLLRLHPFVAAAINVDESLEGFVTDVSSYPDINELLLVSDVLVTDYSSVIYEFSLLDRPMAFFAPDFEEYQAERGFYFDYRTGVPGPVFTTTLGLAEYLSAGEFDTDAAAEFRARSFDITDGHASERVIDKLVLPALR